MLRPVIILALVGFIAAAPLSKPDESHQKKLVRKKRADERIVFGNHQNNERIKKSDPSVPVKDSPAVDKKAEVKVKVSPAEDKSKTSPDVVDETPKQSEKASSAMDIDEEARKLEELLEEERRLEAEKAAKEKDTNAKPSNEESLEQTDQTQNEDALDDLTKADEQMNDVDPDVKSDEEPDTEGSGDIPAQEYTDGYEDFFAPSKLLDSYNYDDYAYDLYPYLDGRRKRSAPEKRSNPGAVKAEDMTDLVATTEVKRSRVKRDLTPEELRELLEAEEEMPVDYTYEDKRGADNDNDDSGWSREELGELLKETPRRYEPAGLEAPYSVPDDDVIEKEKMRLLNYLNDKENDEPTYENSRKLAPYQQQVQESWENLEPAEEVEFKPIVYRGQPGIFIPVKRQDILSLVPGNKRKRDFYPYSLQPSGNWGAFVPQEEQKRDDDDAYDRLYRLARALRRRDWDY